MSVSKVKSALVDFVKGEKDRAIILKGDWGTGKTHLWKQVVLQSHDSFHKRNYSYVSLFGLNSLKDLKKSIYENKVYRERAHIASDESSFEDNLKDISGRFAGWMRKGSSLFNDASAFGVKGIAPIVESLQFLRVTDTLICLDDFERKGSGLHDREILGLISLLVESKNCRVVMLLNEGEVSKGDFISYHEKVFDYELAFTPSIDEAVGLIFGGEDELHPVIARNSAKLKISNIRLLKKIDYFVGVLKPILKDADSKVVEQALHVLPLAVLVIYGGGSNKVDIDFMQNYEGGLTGYLPYADEPSDAEKEELAELEAKIEYLESYGFHHCDDFDKAIIDLVKKGYADEDALNLLVEKFDDKIRLAYELSLYHKAWDVYRSSFHVNDKEVFKAFDEVLSVTLQRLNLFQLGQISTLYESLGKENEVHAAVDEYFSTVMLKSDLKSKDDHIQWPKNEYVLKKLDAYFNSLKVVREVQEIIIEAITGAGLRSQGLILELGGKTQSEFMDFLNSYNCSDINDILKMCLDCGASRHPELEVQQAEQRIFLNVYNSLLLISDGSIVNKSRTAHHISRYQKVYESLLKKTREAESPTA